MRLAACLLLSLVVAVLALAVPALADAATVTHSNSTDGFADGGFGTNGEITRDVTFPTTDFPSGATVSDVIVTLDFAKIDAIDPTCGPPPTSAVDGPANYELYYKLTSPQGTTIDLISAGSYGASDYGGEVVVTLSDAAATAVGGDDPPASGTFRPSQALSAFDGQDPEGTWTLTIGDTFVQDANCFYNVDIAVTTGSQTAVDDSRRVNEDSGASTFRVLANDLNFDGGPLVVESVSDPAHGTAAVANNGLRVSYTPDPDYCNPAPQPDDTFTYTLSGGSTATVSVNVRCVDDPPTAVDNSPGRINEDSGPHLFRVLRNDVNADGGPLVVESVSDPAHGTAAVANGGKRVSYTPDPDYCNPAPQPDDTFTYTLNGGSTATVSVNVRCVDG